MDSTKVKGIVLKLIDYKDADKLASIFTLDYGIILAKFTGVKRDKAKFKAVAQPFVFAEFVLNKSNDKSTVIQADIIDSFPKILLDFNKTICAYIVLDILLSTMQKQKPEVEIFLQTLSSLKNIENEDEFVSTIDFILKFISFNGMGLQFKDEEFVYLDKTTGEFTTTSSFNAVQIDKKVYKFLKAIDENSMDILKNKDDPATIQTKKQTLRLLHNIIYIKFGEDVKSFEYI